MTRLDRCILRMSVFELFRIREVPQNVVLNEAIELAKIYGTENSTVFVNGVLDRVARIITAEDDRSRALCGNRTYVEEHSSDVIPTDIHTSHQTKLVA